MKLKIALLSSATLSLILVILGGFIYFTVHSRILQLQNNELSSRAQSIAQYYASHTGDGDTNNSVQQWIRHYSRHDQELILLGPDSKVIAAVGDLNEGRIMAYFQPPQDLVQNTISIKSRLSVIYTALPVKSEDGQTTLGYVVLVSDISVVQEYMESLLAVLAAGSLGAVLLAGLGGYLIAAAALRPIHQLIRVVEGIEAHRFNERVDTPKGHDEVARLTVTFNHMLSRIERSFEQQMRFVADASHEIRTPLTTILGYANLLNRWGKTDAAVLDKAILVIQKESTRLRYLADDLLFLAGIEADKSERTDERAAVDDIVVEALEELHVLYPSVEVERKLQAVGDALISPHHLKQIVVNLLNNAFKYTPADGRVEVETWKREGNIILRLADTGCGIPEEDLPHIFDRFYRADKSRGRSQGGNGLGLSIVKELVESYGGEIGIESEVGVGTAVTVQLPAYT
jgi:two-component system, OmpR family, sensor histidine kinase ArlS